MFYLGLCTFIKNVTQPIFIILLLIIFVYLRIIIKLADLTNWYHSMYVNEFYVPYGIQLLTSFLFGFLFY